MSLNLGIKKELVAKAGIPIDPPLAIDKPTQHFKTHKFPIVLLEKVEFDPAQKNVDRQTGEESFSPVLNFIYKDTVNGEKKITDKYFPLDPESDSFEVRLEGMQKSIKHVFEEIVGADHFDEADFAGTSFAELFENVANAFNKFTTEKTIKKEVAEGAEPETKTIKIKNYTQVPVYLKLVYFNGRLAPPMFPNFVQRAYAKGGNATVQTVCELGIGKKDIIVNKADAKPANAQSGARDQGFGGAGVFGMDMGAASDMVFPE